MRNARKLAGFIAGTSALSLLLATSAFAEDRHRDETWRGKDREQSRSAQRDQNRDSSHTYNAGEHRDANTNNNNTSRQSRESTYDRNNTSRQSREPAYDRNNTARQSREPAYDRNNMARERNNNRSNDYRANRDYRSNNNNNYSRRESSYRAPRVREQYRNGVARSDGRITYRGRVNRYERYNGGYRVWFDGGLYPYWVPETYFRGHRIGIGVDIRLGGIFRDGGVYVDVLGYPGDPYYNDPYYNEGYYGAADDGFVRGIIDRVDLRSETLFVRDENSRGYVTVDMRSIDWRGSRLDIGDLRPGDRVSLSGAWQRGGLFNAYRVDSIGAY